MSTKVPCIFCREGIDIPTTRSKVEDWMVNRPKLPLIQEFFPELNADERELLLSGHCKDCWDSLMNRTVDYEEAFEEAFRQNNPESDSKEDGLIGCPDCKGTGTNGIPEIGSYGVSMCETCEGEGEIAYG